MVYKEQPEGFISNMEVVGCLIECRGKILLLHRHDNKSQGGKWGIPAGKIDKTDKSKKEAMIRELFEETGLKVCEDDLIYYKTFYVIYSDKKYLYHYHQLKIDKYFDVIIEGNEHKNYVWVTPDEALSMPLVLDEDYCMKDYYGIK